MLLSRRTDTLSIPLVSTCIIHTKGIIKDGDIIQVSSPIFSLIDLVTRDLNMSDKFDVVAVVASGEVTNDGDENIKGILVCKDNDVFNMHVEL